MKREKVYEFSNLGFVKMLWDAKQEKIGKINSVISLIIVLIMLGLGMLSKELGIIMIANMGIGRVTIWLVK